MATVLKTAPAAPPRPGLLETDEYRIDGRIKASGEAEYTADASMPGMLFAAFVGSTMPHARIVSIDTSAARELPGVHAVLTGADIGEHYFGRRLCDWPVLAIDRVLFIGQYVAAVAADTREIADAAAALIDVEYEELPTVFDPEEALAEGALVLHEHPEKYPFIGAPKRPPVPHPNIQGYALVEKGDVEAAFATADRVFEHTFTSPRQHGGYIEPHATLVWIDGDGIAHVRCTNKSPFAVREQFVAATGLPPESFIIEPTLIGGDFGAKGVVIEEFSCYYLALATKRPIKYARTYLDDMQSTIVRHASKITLKTGVTNDGHFVAFSTRSVFDGGAYAAGKPMPVLLPGPAPRSPYRCPNARMERLTVYTNTIPGGFLRAPGEVQFRFAHESHIDMIAHELGIDPLDLRMQNAIAEGQDDLTDIDGVEYLEPRAVDVLQTLRNAVEWDRPLPPGRGRGISLSAREIGGGKTSLDLYLKAGGNVEVRTGTPEQGMGILTLIQRVVAAALGIPLERVHARSGSTNEVPFDPGVGGSRVTHIVGRAALDAALQLRDRLVEAACTIANRPAGSMEWRDGSFVATDGSRNVNWDAATAELVRDGDVKITGSHDGLPKHGVPEWHNFSAFSVEVTVDGDTGEVKIDEVVFVADCGTIINPVAHRGQINGGFVMGLGHAVTEELHVVDGKIANLSLGDYKLPTSRDIPPFRVVTLQTTGGPGPFGAKMIGEMNTAGVAPALANAVAAACGARVLTMPITAERVFEALHAPA